jgi:hypothetical protein
MKENNMDYSEYAKQYIPPIELMKSTIYIEQFKGELSLFGLTWQTQQSVSWFKAKMLKWIFGITYKKHDVKPQ